MKYFWIIVIGTLTSCVNKIPADIIVHNANIFTVNQLFSVEQAMVIRGDSIVEIGPEHQILNKYKSDNTIDARQQYVYPGFIDAHCHFFGFAKNLASCDLRGCESEDEMYKRLIEFDKKNNRDWIIGRGWDQNLWESKNFPNKRTLDSLFPDKNVFLRRIDGHAALVNNKCLELANISSSTEIAGGEILLNKGELSGIIIDNAVDLVSDLVPEISDENMFELLKLAEQRCFAKGITTVSDAGLQNDEVRILRDIKSKNDLDMKFYVMLAPTEDNATEFLEQGPFKENDVFIRSFKFYADGALGSRGALLLKPYADVENNEYGLLLTERETMLEWGKKLLDNGFQMNTHAIGDSANRLMLDLYGEVLGGVNDKRWRIEHAQVVHPDDLEKFNKYNVIPSVQPTHATSDMKWADERLGQRIDNAYAYRTLMGQNGMLALGTDFPVEKIDPLLTLLSAVNRQNEHGEPTEGYRQEESLEFKDALRGITIWAALANFEEIEKGSLEVGKKADFVIMNRDLSLLNAGNYSTYEVQSTFVNGKKVHSVN